MNANLCDYCLERGVLRVAGFRLRIVPSMPVAVCHEHRTPTDTDRQSLAHVVMRAGIAHIRLVREDQDA